MIRLVDNITNEQAKSFAETYCRVLKDTKWFDSKDSFVKTLMQVDGKSKEDAELIWYHIEQMI